MTGGSFYVCFRDSRAQWNAVPDTTLSWPASHNLILVVSGAPGAGGGSNPSGPTSAFTIGWWWGGRSMSPSAAGDDDVATVGVTAAGMN